MTSDRHIKALRRAVGLENEGAFFEAEQLYKQLVRQPKDSEMAHYQYAQFLLRLGEYEKAWPHFMRRLEMPAYRDRAATSLNKPYWDGQNSDIDQMHTILVYADQGIGDALMCSRFLPVLAERFHHVIFMVFEGYRGLFKSLSPKITVMEFGETLPAFDVHTDLFSIPALLNTTPDDIPKAACLKMEPDDQQQWLEHMSSSTLNVGLAWQGNPLHARDQERSARLIDFNSILQSQCNFYSLQVGEAESQISDMPTPTRLKVFPEISGSITATDGKMLKTAALISCLDLVITVDTAVAHLAGVLGVPAWILVSKIPDWRWLMDADTSPWYLESRIYRAQERYDWSHPIERMRHDLDVKIMADNA